MDSLEILLLGGKPYAGKSTLAEEFVETSKELNASHFSIGDRLRDILEGEVQSAHTAEVSAGVEKLKKDAALPYEVVNDVFEEFCTTNPTGLLVVDNYPAYHETFERFKSTTKQIGAKVIAFCKLEVDDATVLRRIKGRTQRWRNVTEDQSFVMSRLEDYRRLVEPTLEELAATYPAHVLDGSLSVQDNASKLRQVYLESQGKQ